MTIMPLKQDIGALIPQVVRTSHARKRPYPLLAQLSKYNYPSRNVYFSVRAVSCTISLRTRVVHERLLSYGDNPRYGYWFTPCNSALYSAATHGAGRGAGLPGRNGLGLCP